MLSGDQIAVWLDAGRGLPVARAAAVLADNPRAESAALILADAALAQALGWRHVVPLLAAGLKRADLRKRDEGLRLACHRAVRTSAIEAVRLVQDLTRRAARLQAVLFASATPVPRADLARVVGQGVSVDLLIEDLIADLEGRAFEVARVGDAWMLRTRPDLHV